jgi:hypothetical protein
MVPENFLSKSAELIQVEVNKFKFFVLKHENQIFIPTHEGLRLIGVDVSWISAMGEKRKKVLKKRQFSFNEKLICYQTYQTDLNRINFFFAGSYSWSDWLILWSYFASYRNTKAIQVLRYLAEQGLEHYI